MRQIKNFMEAKRPMWNCNECKCITMQCWKESEAFCGCGEGGGGGGKGPQPKSYVRSIDAVDGIDFYLFGNENSTDYIHIFGSVDKEITRVGIFEDAVFDDFVTALTQGMMIMFIIGGVDGEQFGVMQTGSFTIEKEAWDVISPALNNPSAEALASVQSYLFERLQTFDFIGQYDHDIASLSRVNEGDVSPSVGEECYFMTAITPYGGEVTVTSSDDSILSIEQVSYGAVADIPVYGVTVIAVANSAGEATITITSKDDPTVSATYTIEVTAIYVTGVQLTEHNVSMQAGQTHQFTANVYPTNATNKNITRTATNGGYEEFISISQTGLLSVNATAGFGPRGITVTATTEDGGFTDSAIVTGG